MRAKKANLSVVHGFTLLELLLVLALAGLLVAFAAPAFFRISDNLHLKTSAQRTLAALRYAHNQAITRSKPLWMVFDKENNLIALLDQPFEVDKARGTKEKADETLPSPLMVWRFPKNVRIRKIVVEGQEIAGTRGVLVFLPNGCASAGEVILEANTSRVYGITVHPITGLARITAYG